MNTNNQLKLSFTRKFLTEFTGDQTDLDKIIDELTTFMKKNHPDCTEFVIGSQGESQETFTEMLGLEEEYDTPDEKEKFYLN
jgi:hypothetical protein